MMRLKNALRYRGPADLTDLTPPSRRQCDNRDNRYIAALVTRPTVTDVTPPDLRTRACGRLNLQTLHHRPR
jgi:hypothetical protein